MDFRKLALILPFLVSVPIAKADLITPLDAFSASVILFTYFSLLIIAVIIETIALRFLLKNFIGTEITLIKLFGLTFLANLITGILGGTISTLVGRLPITLYDFLNYPETTIPFLTAAFFVTVAVEFAVFSLKFKDRKALIKAVLIANAISYIVVLMITVNVSFYNNPYYHGLSHIGEDTIKINLCMQKCAEFCQLNPNESGTDWDEITIQTNYGPAKCSDLQDSKCRCR